MKKLLSALFLLLASFSFAQNITFESNHFIFNGEENDITEEVVNFCEDQYLQNSQNLSIELEKKITLNIYPDLKTFHTAINYENATDYCINHYDSKHTTGYSVSPYNPGPFHSALSIKASLASNIECSFLYSCYDLPKWIVETIGFYKRSKILEESPSYTKNMSEALQRVLKKEENFKIANIANKNTFLQFEKEYKTGNKEEARNTASEKSALSNSFVQYIIDNWNYVQLLQSNKNDSCEKLFGMNVQELEKQWLEYTKAQN